MGTGERHAQGEEPVTSVVQLNIQYPLQLTEHVDSLGICCDVSNGEICHCTLIFALIIITHTAHCEYARTRVRSINRVRS